MGGWVGERGKEKRGGGGETKAKQKKHQRKGKKTNMSGVLSYLIKRFTFFYP